MSSILRDIPFRPPARLPTNAPSNEKKKKAAPEESGVKKEDVSATDEPVVPAPNVPTPSDVESTPEQEIEDNHPHNKKFEMTPPDRKSEMKTLDPRPPSSYYKVAKFAPRNRTKWKNFWGEENLK